MTFKSLVNEFGFMRLDFAATWKYGYDFILDALQEIISTDFQENTEIITFSEKPEDGENLTHQLKENNMQVRSCPDICAEHDTITICGQSRIMNVYIYITFYNNSNRVRLMLKEKKYIRKKGKNAFNTYMDSMEINAYCRAAVRNASGNP